MAYKVQWDSDGKPSIACDTLAEAIEVVKQGSLLNGNGGRRASTDEFEPKTVSEQVAAIFSEISTKAKTLLKGLANHPQGVELNEALGRECGTEPAGFGGVLGAVSKEAKKVHLTLDHLVKSESLLDGERRYRWLTPTKLLLEHKGKLQ